MSWSREIGRKMKIHFDIEYFGPLVELNFNTIKWVLACQLLNFQRYKSTFNYINVIKVCAKTRLISFQFIWHIAIYRLFCGFKRSLSSTKLLASRIAKAFKKLLQSMHSFEKKKKHKYQWKVFLENFSQNLRENYCIICWQTKRTKRRNEAAKQRMMYKLQCNQPVKHSYHTQHDLICCQRGA